MMRSFYQVYQSADQNQMSHYCEVGYVMSLIAQSPRKDGNQISYLNSILSPALQTRQICFLFNEDGTPVAYLIWAHLAPDVEERVLKSFRFDFLHVSEWNEGDSLWLVDLVAPHGHFKNVLRFARDTLFRDEQRVRYLRANRNFRYAVEHARNNFSGCLRSMPPVSQHCRCGRIDCKYYESLGQTHQNLE